MNTISLLTNDELASAYRIEQLSHAFPWTEQTFYSNQGERYLNLKIISEGKIVGFCITQVVVDEATLFNIAIDPAYQRQGLAKQLLTHLIEQLEQRGIATIWLEVRASNTKAINLYQALGFNEISVRPNYYPSTNNRYEDAIIMANMLTF